MFLIKPKYTEDLRTILSFILGMPEVTRHEFYKSVEGQNILKGIQIEAENDKTPRQSSGDTRKWDKEELDKVIKQVHEASPEQREAILQLLPGPVVSMILARIKPIAGEEPDVKLVKGVGTGAPAGTGTGVRGPQKGTPGYEQWKAKLQMTRAANRKTPQGNGKPGYGEFKRKHSGPSEKEFDKESKIGKTDSKKVEGGRGYKHFVRQIGEHGEIHDSPAGKKEKGY